MAEMTENVDKIVERAKARHRRDILIASIAGGITSGAAVGGFFHPEFSPESTKVLLGLLGAILGYYFGRRSGKED